MATLENQVINLDSANIFLTKDYASISSEIDNLFTDLTKKLSDRLIGLVKTDEGQKKMEAIIINLQKEIDNLKAADKEMTQIFKDYIDNRSDLQIKDELINIYNELFFMQVKLINDTIYKVVQDKNTPKSVNLKPLLGALHKKIKLLNKYITDNSLEKKLNP